jgi:mannose-1-phosphate guanylyltransferase/mannose-6-phosphate isomerase
MSRPDGRIVPVILSGGSGTRLWPLSREQLPKQLLALVGNDRTMLQDTVVRVRDVPAIQSPIVVCNEEHRFLIADQLAEMGVADARILLEPIGRNTAPAVALAAEVLLSQAESTEDPLLLVLPADHVIADAAVFRATVTIAAPFATAGKLVTFGVVPTAPETGYGYIRHGELRAGAAPIEEFIEKPDHTRAANFLQAGDYLWNSGMFLFSARTYLRELQRQAPTIAGSVAAACSNIRRDGQFIRVDRAAFEACPSDSIDYAIMEGAESGMVVPLEAGWSDVGSWSSLHEAMVPDANGNALRGDVLARDTTNSLVIAESRLVATVGLKGHVVVETKDAVLVVPSDQVQEVKSLVGRIREAGRSEHVSHREVHRPWGTYDSVEAGPGYQVKRLSVKPGGAMSLQRHRHRAEHWVVVAGVARITRDDEVFDLRTNQSTYIPLGAKHRIENPGSETLHIIEVQTGDYLGEDDIERFEDRYGREAGS